MNQLAVYEQTNKDILAQAEDFKIESQDDYIVVVAYTKAIKLHVDSIKEFFEESRKNAHTAYKGILAQIKKYSDDPGKAEGILRKKMGRWRAAQEVKRLDKEVKLREEAEKKGLDKELVQVAKPEQPKGVSYRKSWRFRVVDPSKLPPVYLKPDEQAINGTVQAQKGATNIPGVEVYFEEIPVIRGS